MLLDIQTSIPPYKVNQKSAAEELKKRMGENPVVHRLIDTASRYSGIESRHLVIPDGDSQAEVKFYSDGRDVLNPGTAERMQEYEKWVKLLSYNAVRELLDRNNINPSAISRIITISCTGLFAPGLDQYLTHEFSFPLTARKTNIGFMGCAASINGLALALESLALADEKEDSAVLMLAVELCSLHLQTEATRDNILSNVIFSDGCAAALFSRSLNFRDKAKFELTAAFSHSFENSSEMMAWKIGNNGFEMTLSQELPQIIYDKAVPALLNILHNAGIKKEDVKYWALHPGGRAILDSLQKGLQLTDHQVRHSRCVLKEFGNMSSPTILYVIKEILNEEDLQPGGIMCAVAFGPGLTMEVALLRAV